ncbi:putative ATP-dependent protease [Cytobacillus purgationiresistens]|uniref:ATP-dependent protease n=1 Tax=Cytobacillus purgationiresistens TaxID=863449 RepID=A0ABU0ASR8_9BACI|nr:putative ATP-dependent protease [Cytobacillus purgationiresistens]
MLSSVVANGELQNDIPISVTGAISNTGMVKEVGYIKEKVLIADKDGFSHMIIPIANLNEANKIKEKQNLHIQIIGVRNVDKAIQLIKDLNSRK